MSLSELVKRLFKGKECKCGWYDVSRKQYDIHCKENLDKTWLTHYGQAGCYHCDGKDKTCPVYFNNKK